MAKTKRTPEGYKNHLARGRAAKKLKRQTDPEYRKKDNEAALKRYYAKGDKSERTKAGRKWWAANWRLVSQRRKAFRRDNPDFTHERDRKCRESTLKFALAEFRRGNITYDELDRRLGQAIARYDEKCKAD